MEEESAKSLVGNYHASFKKYTYFKKACESFLSEYIWLYDQGHSFELQHMMPRVTVKVQIIFENTEESTLRALSKGE